MSVNDEDTKKRAAVRARYPSKPPEGCSIEELLAFKDSQLHLWEAAAEQMSDGFIATNHLGHITHANPAAAKLFMRRKQVLERLEVMSLLQDPVTRLPPAKVRSAILAGQSIDGIRVAIERSNGDLVYASMSVVPHVEEGVLVRVFGFFRDLTEIEHVSHELKVANRQQDAETRLYSRVAFVDRLGIVSRIARKLASPVALVHVVVGNYTCRGADLPQTEMIQAIANSLRLIKEPEQVLGRVAPDGFTLLAPVIHADELPLLIRRVRDAASVPWSDTQGHSQPPAPIACDGLLCAAEEISEAVRMLEQVEQLAVRARRDSGSFRLSIRKPS